MPTEPDSYIDAGCEVLDLESCCKASAIWLDGVRYMGYYFRVRRESTGVVVDLIESQKIDRGGKEWLKMGNE
ncbi:9914_t:CDS:2 [Acaulospora colombiana]|uniref:9914_t:CDS:1 n=1 Tax=Acaulospora colombiana TaxID=27376 RepID=A0ACA9N0U3_9GLOM|nr:9914_t:CDS:2 [Acaulospora colombiana]